MRQAVVVDTASCPRDDMLRMATAILTRVASLDERTLSQTLRAATKPLPRRASISKGRRRSSSGRGGHLVKAKQCVSVLCQAILLSAHLFASTPRTCLAHWSFCLLMLVTSCATSHRCLSRCGTASLCAASAQTPCHGHCCRQSQRAYDTASKSTFRYDDAVPCPAVRGVCVH